MVHFIHGRAFLPPPDADRLAYREQRDQIRTEVATFSAQIRAAEQLQMRLVYGVLRAEVPVVKIGTTRRIAGHKGRLRRMPGCSLVAVMAGGYSEEREVHERLARHRVKFVLTGHGHGEHFVICDDVIEWVNETRHAVGAPMLDTATVLSQYGL